MSLSNYAGLQAEIASWLRRADLSAEIPTFIALAEAQMNRRLRNQRMVARNSAFAITAQLMPAPADFVAPRSMMIISGTTPRRLDWVSEERMDQLLGIPNFNACGPDVYTLEGSNFRFAPDPGAGPYTASVSYYQALPPLASNTSNWLLAAHPDAYLYGSLAQSAPYLKADERLEMWVEIFGQIIGDINTSDSGLGGSLEIVPNTFGAGWV